MSLREGTKVRIYDGYGRVTVKQAEVTLEPVNGTVFVREELANRVIHYGVPVYSVEEIEINTRPTFTEVTMALRKAFRLDRGR